MKNFVAFVLFLYCSSSIAMTKVSILPGSTTTVAAGDSVEVTCSGKMEKSYFCYCDNYTGYFALTRGVTGQTSNKILKRYDFLKYGGEVASEAACEADFLKHPACL